MTEPVDITTGEGQDGAGNDEARYKSFNSLLGGGLEAILPPWRTRHLRNFCNTRCSFPPTIDLRSRPSCSKASKVRKTLNGPQRGQPSWIVVFVNWMKGGFRGCRGPK
jgi:hypothetical protein